MLGGEIKAESETNKGSIFTVTIATGSVRGVRMIESSASHEITLEKLPAPTKQGPTLDCRILLAEDGVDNQRLISFILKKAGADVAVVENCQAAMERVEL